MKYLRPHGRGHKYQRGIPKALQPLFGGRKIKTVFYDATISSAEAQRRAVVQWATDGAEFERLSKLTAEEREAVVGQGGLEMAEVFSEFRANVLPVYQAAGSLDLTTLDLSDGRKALRRVAGVKDAQMAATRLQKVVERDRKVLRRVRGDRAAEGKKLTVLLDLWQTVVAPRDPRARERYERSLSLLVEAVGDLAPEAVTQAHATSFRDWLGEHGMGHGAQQKAIDHVRAIFSAARKDGKLSFNPFSGVNPRKPQGWKLTDKKKRYPFTAAEVRSILEKLSVLTEQTNSEGRRQDIEWVIKLTIYQGCRINEVANLRKQDVRKIDGIWCLDLNDEERRLKNLRSVRVVPLHPKCSGFAKFAAKSEGPWVFGLTDYKEGQRAGWIIRRFGAFLDGIGITRPKVSQHSFRHRWIDAARAAGVPEDVRRAIAGHESEGGAHGDYGEGFGVARMLEELRKVDPLKG